MLSGGSSASWSDTCTADTVTVHVSAKAKSASGSSVNDVGPPVAVAVWPLLEPHEIEYQLPVTSTGSLKVIVMFASRATPVAPLDGVLLATEGALSASQRKGSATLLRGLGDPTLKSVLLLSVSVQPWLFLSAAVVLLSVAVGAVSEQFVPAP